MKKKGRVVFVEGEGEGVGGLAVLAGEIFYLLKICILRLILWIIYQIRVSFNPQRVY